jgi:hypothetical protein
MLILAICCDMTWERANRYNIIIVVLDSTDRMTEYYSHYFTVHFHIVYLIILCPAQNRQQ